MGASETLFGVAGSKQHTPAEMAEHALISAVHGKKVFLVNADGSQASFPRDFFVEAAQGRISGVNIFNIAGHSEKIGNDIQTVWEHTTSIQYLSTDTQLYASSTNSGDNFIGYVTGFDSNYNQITRLFTANGQNQVALSSLMFRVVSYGVLSETNLGDVYIAETDTLTGGIPDTTTKVQGKMIATRGQGVNAFYAIPAGKKAYVHNLTTNVAKAKDAQIFLKFKVGGITNIAPPFEIFQSSFSFPQTFNLPEKAEIEIMARSNDIDSRISVALSFKLFNL